MWRQWSLSQLLSWWEEAVDEVERGHICCIDDYSNDISVRYILSDAIAGLNARDRHWLMPRLKSIDQRFTRATRPATRRRRGSRRRPWFARFPARGLMRTASDPAAAFDPEVRRRWVLRPLDWPPELEG